MFSKQVQNVLNKKKKISLIFTVFDGKGFGKFQVVMVGRDLKEVNVVDGK